MKRRILIVEDDRDISMMIQSFLKDEFDFDAAFDGKEGLDKLENGNYDLVILDIMMPKLNGLDMLRVLREDNQIPVIILSAKGTDMDKALGLGFGADDYLHKPFSMIELQARIKAVMRRSNTRYNSIEDNKGVLRVGRLELNPFTFSVTKDNKNMKLTSKEFDILQLFMKNPERVYTKAQLYYSIWGEEYLNDDNAINVHIRRLREKVEDDPSKPKFITTVWGIGYKFGGNE